MTFWPLHIQRDWPTLGPIVGVKLCEDTQGIVAVDANGEYAAAVILDSWSHSAVQSHIWIKNPMVIRRGFFREVADHVFNTCGRRVLIGVVPGNNAKALKFDKHIGFEEVARIPDGHDVGVDLVIMQMRYENCRWLNDGREKHTQSA